MEPQSHEWLHGFAIAVWLHLAHQSIMKSMHNPYGPTIKRSQCYGSTKPCMTSWLRHRGLASFATPIVYQNQYIGVTIKRTQCYGAIGTSVAPWLRHLGLPSFGTPIRLSFMTSMHHPYGSTIKRAQNYGAPKPSLAPWLRRPGLASCGAPIAHEAISRLWVDHKTNTMLIKQSTSVFEANIECTHTLCHGVCIDHRNTQVLKAYK